MGKNYVYAIVLVVCTSCLGYKEMPVEYDYSYKGNFKKYKTFDIMKPVGTADSSMINATIERSILSRMKFLGYKQTDNKPHLLVSFKMFEDSMRFNGYNQPEIEQWVAGGKEDASYDQKKLQLKTGTLLIQLYDRKQNRSIWQGYSTDLYGAIDFHDHRTLRNAVISILDKYRFWAEGFIEKGNPEQAAMVN
ncbi:MAG: DUF4136 domain-containing protein [Cyclobacteriaceae bacterium]|nr:DUF4136 domain-containing protein [Cyclobacteriaceae bacterium]